MAKDPTLSAGKMSSCFDTKPLMATLLAFTLVMLIWNLQPYYDTIINSPASPTPTPSSSKLSISDPNKRTFRAYGNAASLFVQMGAYRGGPTTFAVVGLASKPLHVFGRPWYKCEWIPNSNGNTNANASSSASKNLKAKAIKILPDWGYGRVYTVVVVNCTFAVNPNIDNKGGKLILYAYYRESPKRYEKITALEEAPGSYDESKFSPPYPYEYLYCGSSLYGNVSASRMREWMAYHAWFFGPSSHFVFHDAGGVSPEVRAVLEPWIHTGRVTLQDIRDQSEFDGYYYNQFLVVNDCLHRYRHAANWTFYFDVDEYIYLPDRNTLESVLRQFSNNTQFTIEQNAMSSMLCFNDSSQDYSRQWGFEKLLFRDSRTNIRRDRKYAIQAKNAYATGVHMSENVIGGTLHQTETKIRYYHYHNSITVHEELCRELVPLSSKHNITWFDKRPYVYDDNMKKLAQTIKDFERHTINVAPDHTTNS
ncbi:PREDICTED: galactan beta-1,4-galactosyltransferase GALS1 [Nicotiana attenuata]|uniref:Glycosyltransferase family 92 protein n=1 Tax=Nicotiana attenuata TaxID=49451 RepID=A0A1J6JTY7_NICAT|nr:PREDICTED: galactan beta-1,4-galactosyltransferase GALS1 [Nicotiana attenuata]OIT21186.1 galactan beta-1,4-galactosyltransferase gals1 [Nicotiana attenuata]